MRPKYRTEHQPTHTHTHARMQTQHSGVPRKKKLSTYVNLYNFTDTGAEIRRQKNIKKMCAFVFAYEYMNVYIYVCILYVCLPAILNLLMLIMGIFCRCSSNSYCLCLLACTTVSRLKSNLTKKSHKINIKKKTNLNKCVFIVCGFIYLNVCGC